MDRDKPCCLRPDTAERDVSSGITLFALSTFYLVLNTQQPSKQRWTGTGKIDNSLQLRLLKIVARSRFVKSAS